MKKLFLFFALVSAAFAQEFTTATGITGVATGTLTLPTYGYSKQADRVTLNSKGEWTHAPDVKIKVAEVSSERLVLECSRAEYVIVWGGATKEARWREIYTVKNGKIFLDKIVEAKITPAQEQKVEWPESK